MFSVGCGGNGASRGLTWHEAGLAGGMAAAFAVGNGAGLVDISAFIGTNLRNWVTSGLAVIRPEREFGWVQSRQHGMPGTFCTSCCKRNWNERSLERHQAGIRHRSRL